MHYKERGRAREGRAQGRSGICGEVFRAGGRGEEGRGERHEVWQDRGGGVRELVPRPAGLQLERRGVEARGVEVVHDGVERRECRAARIERSGVRAVELRE